MRIAACAASPPDRSNCAQAVSISRRKFTQTLFVRFDSNPSLENLRDSLGLAGGGAFDPHVSLLYKKMPADKQAQLAAVVRLPFQTVCFDALQIVRCRLPVATEADVAGWEMAASRRLGT